MDLRVRSATPADVPGIRRVASAGWRAAYGDIMDEATIEETLSAYYAPEEVERSVTAESVVYLVAVAEERVLGYASGTDSDRGPGAELVSIYVTPDRWGEGVGSRLFEELRARLRQRGYERVRAVVLAANDVGLLFYCRHGFERVEEREEVVGGEPHRAFVVAREL
jgi:ribosomal protein S18 acetylase RimI-like enzyme